MSRSKVPKLLSLIYFHNPFYLISACLFVYGLKLLFRAGDSSVLFQQGTVTYMEPWGLMSAFAGVTVLMAVTAILIVRLGKVWEDARSLILIVLLMLLAISVSFDEIINVLSDRDNSPRHVFLMFGISAAFALAVSDVLIRGLGIKFGVGFRLPLYGFLLLFFLWPVLLLTELTGFSKETTRWLIAAFPLAAGLLTMTLFPAIRAGSGSVKENGTPWSWPLYPWTPFVFIGIAVLFRSYSLTMSFDPVLVGGHYWDTTFGIYQLMPFLLAILFLLLEIGLREKRSGLQRGILLAAPILLLLSHPWLVPWSRLPSYAAFTYSFVEQIGSPVFLAIIGLAMLYGYAWLRGVRRGELGFYAMVSLACVIGPRAFGTRVWQLQHAEFAWWPLLLPATILIVNGIRQRRSFQFFAGIMCALFAAHLALADFPGVRPWRVFILLHVGFMSVLLIGIVFRDNFAKALQALGPPALSATMLAGIVQLGRNDTGVITAAIYAAAFTLAAFRLYYLIRNWHYLIAAVIHCGVALTGGISVGVFAFVHAPLPAGTKPVLLATASFLIAVFISVLKSGLSRRIRMYWLIQRRSASR